MAKKIANKKNNKIPVKEIKVGGRIIVCLKFMIALLPMILLFALFFLGIVKLWQKGIESEVFKIKPSIFIANGNEYSVEALREFDRLSNTFSGVSLLQPGLLDRVEELYSKSPWIEQVCSLKRVYPNKINIEFVPRFACVQLKHDGYYWLVAQDGVLLPADGIKKPYPALPVIKGDIENRPENGQVWHSEGVSGALRALQEIKRSKIASALEVSEIEIKAPSFLDKLSRPGRSRPRLLINTDSKISIMWGTCEEGYPGELGSEQKIELIKSLLIDWKNNGNLGREVCFDVRTKVAGYNL